MTLQFLFFDEKESQTQCESLKMKNHAKTGDSFDTIHLKII